MRPERAHPRSRGENDEFAGVDPFAVGSSPLARGKPGLDLDRADASRLIPARAGKTVSMTEVEVPAQAHPRSRGENYPACSIWYPSEGSSPLARGKPVRLGNGWIIPRLIPARAGKTRSPPSRRRTCRAHPRSRGENLCGARTSPTNPGSSPLARGKRSPGHAPRICARLIPARAGKTPRPRP